MKRMHLKKRRSKKHKIVNSLTLIIILIILLIIYIFKVFNDKALPQLISYSEIETKKIVSSIINSTVVEEIANNIDIEDLFITTKDSEGNVKSIDFNTSEVNKILASSTKVVEKNLKYLETGDVEKLNLTNNILSNYDLEKLKKGIIYEVPSGIIFNNSLLNNIFPKIPVKMDLIGNIFCRLNTDIESYGINNALIKVNIGVEVEVKILMPFVSSSTKIQANIPVVIKIIEGNVPSYYFNGYLGTPSLTTDLSS